MHHYIQVCPNYLRVSSFSLLKFTTYKLLIFLFNMFFFYLDVLIECYKFHVLIYDVEWSNALEILFFLYNNKNNSPSKAMGVTSHIDSHMSYVIVFIHLWYIFTFECYNWLAKSTHSVKMLVIYGSYLD